MTDNVLLDQAKENYHKEKSLKRKSSIKLAAWLAGTAVVLGTCANTIYDRAIRDDPETLKNFPPNVLAVNTEIDSKKYDIVRNDITYVEMVQPIASYKQTKNSDGTTTYEGPFKYRIRENSSFFIAGKGEDIRHGKVTVKTIEDKLK